MKLRKFAASTLCVAAAALLAGCSLIFGDEEKIEFFPVQVEEDGEWGFMNGQGQMVLKEEFKTRPSVVINGYFSVGDDDKYTLYAFDEKKPVAVKNAEDVKAVGFVAEGLVPVVEAKKRIGLLDPATGEMKFMLDPCKGKEIMSCRGGFVEGMLLVRNEDGMEGFVDTKGNYVIEPKYTDVNQFAEGLAVVDLYNEKQNETTYSVIDKKGDVVFKLKKGYYPMGKFQNGRLFAHDDKDRWFYFDKEGELTKLPSKVEAVAQSTKDVYVFYNDGQAGIMNFDDEVIVRAKYSDIVPMEDGEFLANKEKKAVILNKKGDEVTEIEDYDFVYYVKGLGIIARDNKTYLMLDGEGKPLKGADFRNYSLEDYAGYGINSDFFNMTGMADKIAAEITAKGFGKYTLGSSAGSVKGGQPTYSETYQNYFAKYDLGLKGFRWTTVEARFNFTANMADYNYDYYSYSSSYSWNTASRLQSVVVSVRAEVELGKDGVTALVNACNKRGYKAITPEGKNAVMMQQGNVLLVIDAKKDDRRLEILLLDNSLGYDYIPGMRENITNFNNEQDGIDNDRVVAAVDSTAY